MSALELQVADRFPPGTKVGAYPRIGDFFTPGQMKPSAEATVGKDGTVKLTGLVEHGPYFIAGEVELVRPGQGEVTEWHAVAVTASDPAVAETAEETAAQTEREAAAAAKVAQSTAIDTAAIPGGAPQPTPVHQIIEGARDTSHIRPERVEGVKKGTPLASHTVTGQAVVVEPEEKAATKKGGRK